MEGEGHFLRRPLGWLERLVYRVSGVDGAEQSWSTYTIGMLAFSAFGLLVTYGIQRLQHRLPFNPQKLGPVEALSSFNTAASFTTNTNCRSYVGETTMTTSARWPACLAQLHLGRGRDRDRDRLAAA
jgi:K+-transporting ATPase ATPase A chain